MLVLCIANTNRNGIGAPRLRGRNVKPLTALGVSHVAVDLDVSAA